LFVSLPTRGQYALGRIFKNCFFSAVKLKKRTSVPLSSKSISFCPPALLKIWALVVLSFVAGQSMACGSSAAVAALQSQQVAGKFSLLSQFCDERKAASAPDVAASGVSGLPASRPLDASDHAQQLHMYDNNVTTPVNSGAVPGPTGVLPMPAPSSPEILRKAEPASSGSQGRSLKNVSKESAARAVALVPEINRVAAAYQIDPLLLHAIAHVESRHNPDAVSHAGAMGLMQVMPATARRFGVTSPHSELRNPKISLEVCATYLKNLQKRFDNNLTLVIAAYNAGEGAVEKYGRKVPPYKETQGYVRDVMAHYLLLVSVRDGQNRSARATL
jgi:soluble lytic murein transglycosylase-like protein